MMSPPKVSASLRLYTAARSASGFVTTISYVISHVPSTSWVVEVSVFSISTMGRSISAQSDESSFAIPLVTVAVFHTPPPWFTTDPQVSASSVTVAGTVTVRDTV